MDMTALFFPQGNDIVVTAKFPEITDGTGMTAEFWYKFSKVTPDDDPSTLVYQKNLVLGDDGVWYSEFDISAVDNEVTGAFWWRIDCIDATGKRRTPDGACGTLLVEAV